MDTRKQLQDHLSEYVMDTLNYIQTVRDFCDKLHEWTLEREKELKIMRHIKDRADKVSHQFDYLKRSNNKAKALWECLKNSVKSINPLKSIIEELEKELGAVLKNTLQGLKKLDIFLDAVDKLAVTSPYVFTEQSFMSEDESPESVRSIITAARMTSPLLINFKRNAETFFLPLLSNLEVLTFQLDKYTQTTKQICERMKKYEKDQPVLRFSWNFSEDSMQKMLDHLKQLCKIRMDEHTRLALIFQVYALRFIGLFSQCRSRMEKHLSDLEESAVQLDRMKKGASISSVAGSSVGIVGGALSIAGLALAPVTAGLSLGLTIAGVGLGVTSGVNSLVTGATEIGVNLRHGKKTQNIFKQYMEDVEKILSCLDQASKQERGKGPDKFNISTAGKLAFPVVSVGQKIASLVDGATAVKVLQTEEVIAAATKAGLQGTKGTRNIPKLAADLPDIGQLAKGTPLALSKSARAGFIAANAIFIGVDVFFICKESISLANGSKSETSQLIRSRAALWRSELEDWKKIHDSLCIGIWRFRKSQEVLEQPFLP